ncbi:MAG: hypothetical protein JSR19_10950 [Proteobacteria bacterium]|nr:hypothetical protein [Pseudomonadota bacterium]HQR02561.1 hypothetical protein [Rhodocyclaceae bacterium]
MKPSKLILLFATIGLTAHSALTFAADTLRPDVQKALFAAQELLKAQKPADAMAKIKEAEAIPDRTDFENYTIAQLLGPAAAALGDNLQAATAFDTMLNSGRAAPGDRLKLMQYAGISFYKAQHYPEAAKWLTAFFKEGGKDVQLRTVLGQSLFMMGDFATSAKEMGASVDADIAAGQKPDKSQIQILANCYLKQKDMSGYAATLEKLITYYPTKEGWADLINQIASKTTFASNLRLDAGRLRLATDNVRGPGDYMELGMEALEVYPAEAQKILNEGFAKGVLGTGPDAKRQTELRDKAAKNAATDAKSLASDEKKATAAKNGDPAVAVGFNFVTQGKLDKGIALMEQGLQKGGLKHPDEAKLHLGVAYQYAGKKDKALETFKTVQGADGAADLARLWTILLTQQQ